MTYMSNETNIGNTAQGPLMADAVRPCHIFLIEDDADDARLARREIEACEKVRDVTVFKNGRELKD